MNNYSLEVVGLTKRTISHSIMPKKTKKFKYAYLLIFLLVNIIAFSATHFIADYDSSVASTGFYSQFTHGHILDDLKSVVFATAEFGDFNEEISPELVVPIATNEFSVEDDGAILFVVESNIMVVASAKGVVVDSGILATGGKFVEIKHSKTLSTKYENIEIAGVVRGDVVKEGQDIGTCKVGEVVRFSVLFNGELVDNINIENNMVAWQEQE